MWEAIGALAAAVASLVAVAGLVLANRGDEASGETSDDSTEVTADTSGEANGGGGGDDNGPAVQSENVETVDTGGEETTTTSDTESEDPAGPDLALFLEPSCSIVGSGGISGDDVMTFFFRARNVGEDEYDGGIRATALSDSGLQGSSTGGAADGPASSFVQIELAPQDYGRTHTFTIEVEATEDLDETDLDNNRATIDVSLPDDPPESGETIDPCD